MKNSIGLGRLFILSKFQEKKTFALNWSCVICSKVILFEVSPVSQTTQIPKICLDFEIF